MQLLLSQIRPFEAQLSGQPHLPILRTRGQSDASVSYGLLDGEMTRLGADDYQMGRFYLIQKDFIRAIPFLKRQNRSPWLLQSFITIWAPLILSQGTKLFWSTPDRSLDMR